jgi:hypothetical protein
LRGVDCQYPIEGVVFEWQPLYRAAPEIHPTTFNRLGVPRLSLPNHFLGGIDANHMSRQYRLGEKLDAHTGAKTDLQYRVARLHIE